jgi:hypothetical protein
VAEGRLRCRCHGNECGNLICLAHAYLFREVVPNPQIIAKLKEVASEEKGTAAVHFTRPIPNHVLRFREKDSGPNSASGRASPHRRFLIQSTLVLGGHVG